MLPPNFPKLLGIFQGPAGGKDRGGVKELVPKCRVPGREMGEKNGQFCKADLIFSSPGHVRSFACTNLLITKAFF